MAGLPSESQLQAQIVQGLRLLGYVVLECGRFVRQVRCPECSRYFVPTAGYGNSLGTPDLLVADPAWPHPTWVGIELKRPTTRTTIGTVRGGIVSKEQRDLAIAGRTVICHDLDQVLAVVRSV
jgi:hypothetical protein